MLVLPRLVSCGIVGLMAETTSRVLCIPHGGGPMPVLGEPSHGKLIEFLSGAEDLVGRPSAILLVSAHWECPHPTLTSRPYPELIYDYGGFPPETYQLQYPAPGAPDLAARGAALLEDAGFSPRLDDRRGFDHGMFIPLMLMYPDATIPVVQLSLLSSLDPAAHLAMGAAIGALADDDVLILGSGFTFHNMNAFFSSAGDGDPDNEAFEEWLNHVVTDPTIGHDERARLLTGWADAPGARWCHPREEHLLPLHVCAGAGEGPAVRVFDDTVLGKRASGYTWS